MKNKILNILLILFIILAISSITIVFFLPDNDTDIKEIDLTKLTYNELEEYFNTHKDVTKTYTFIYSDEYLENEIISYIFNGSNHYDVVISKGIDLDVEIEIPELSNFNNRVELEQFFEDNHFSDVDYIYVFSELEKGTIIKISETGSVKRSKNIIVTISAGEDNDSRIEMPDFINKAYAEVVSWTNLYNVSLTYDYDLSDDYAAGRVMTQSIAAGTYIEKGSKLNIVVCYGKGVAIPDISNKTKTDIETWANNNDMGYIHFQYVNSDTVKENYIISVSPSSGIKVSTDYNVFFTVSLGPKKSVQKGYEGKTESEFVNYIKSLSLNPINDDNSKYSSYPKGTILRYDQGSYSNGSNIYYSLSLGQYEFNVTDFNDLTLKEAKELTDVLIEKDGILKFEYETIYDGKNINIIYDCSYSNGVIACKLGANEKDKAYIMSADLYEFKGTYEAEVLYLNERFSKFVAYGNVEYIAIDSEEDSPGVILSIGVKTSTDDEYLTNYKEGYYYCETTKIQIKIAK